MIKELTSLRFIFLCMIYLYHMGYYPTGGPLGVAFFFVLSGFVLTLGYKDRILKRELNYHHKKIDSPLSLALALFCCGLFTHAINGRHPVFSHIQSSCQCSPFAELDTCFQLLLLIQHGVLVFVGPFVFHPRLSFFVETIMVVL